MAMEKQRLAMAARKACFDWHSFISFLLNAPGKRESIGAAWFLFFDIANNADLAGIYTETYSKLARKYGVSLGTVKAWRQHLKDSGVIESYSKGNSVALRLLEPYVSFVNEERIDIIEEKDIEEMKYLMTLKKLMMHSGGNKDLTKIHESSRGYE